MIFQKLVIIQILAFAVFFVDTAAAAPLTFNVDGVISDSTDQPLESASVTFTVQVKDSTETCLLYQETFPLSMTGSNGYFSLVVGKQTNGVSGGSTLDKVFSNASTAIPGQSCTYTPSSTSESRKIIVSFNDGSGSQVFTTQEIQSVPYAVAASEAAKFTDALSGDVTGSQTATVVAKIQGKPVDMTGIADGKILKYQSGSFVVADDATGTSGITSLNGLTATSQSFSAIDLGNSVLAPAWTSSTSAHTLKIPMASGTGVTAGLISNSEFTSFSTKITALTGDVTASGVGTVNATIGAGKVTSSHILDGTVIGADMDFTAINSATSDLVLKDSGTGKFATFTCATPNYVLTWTAAGWACQAPATTGLPLTGGTMSGAVSMGSNNLTNVGNLTMVPGGYLLLPNTATNGGTAGQVWYDAGNIKYYDGSAVKTLSTGTSGMSNALSTGQIWVGNVSGGAEARSLNGDITSTSATGAVVVTKTTTGTANTILSLDGSSVATMAGVALVNTGTVTLSAGTASSNYVLKLPAASPTGNQVMQVDSFGNLTWIATPSFSMPALNDGLIWIGNGSNGASAQTLTGDATISNTGVLTLKNTGTVGTYYKVTTDAQGRVISGSGLLSADVTTALSYVPLKKAGDTMSGDLGTQNINMAANTYLKLSANSTDGTSAGQMWYDGGIIKYYDGSTVKSLGVAGAGITSLNGLTSASQTFVTGTSGTDFNLSFSGITHTFNLPSASATNRGALTSTDWNTFNSKQSNTLASGNLFVGNTSGGAEARAISGDITIDNVGFTTLKNTGTVGTYTKVVTDAQGRVISGLALASGDVTAALGYTPSNGVGSYLNGGNSFGAAATLGTNDANSLSFQTNSTTRMVIDANGKVSIGGGAPNASLDMSSQTDAIIMPKGATVSRPGSAVAGMIRYNTTNNTVEYYDGTSWSAVGNALGYTPLNKAGDAMSGALAMGSNDITGTGNITMSANKYLTLSNNTTSGTTAGQVWYDAGIIKYFDGTTVKSLGVAGAGITSLNGLTTGSQTFGNGTTGNSPNWNSAGSGHILHIPMANTTSVTAGLISKTEYDTFNSKQSSALAAGQVWVGNTSGAAEARALSGDIAAVSGIGQVTVDKTTTGQANKILALDGTGVANVKGLDVQTGTGKVTLQTAGAFTNYVLTLPTTAGTANQVMATDGAGNLGWATPLTSSTAFINGGNTFAGNSTIGLNDAYTLGFETSGSTRMTITAAGNVGIGTATPSGTLDVQGGTAAASTTGNSITLAAQNGGSGAAAGGSINLTPGAGTGGFPSGSVVVTATNGQSGAILATNNMTNGYATSSASATNPSYVLRLANTFNANGNTALIETSVKNSSSLFQESYMGFVSVTGASNYSSDFVMGMSTGANAYSERLRIVGSNGNVGIGTSSPSYSLDFNGKTDAIRLPAGTTAQQPTAAAGLLRYNTTTNNVEFHNGTSWVTVGVSGAGISSLNGLTVTAQTFGNGTVGNLPNWSSSGSGHTLNIPMANTSAVTAGLISKTEYDTFNSKQSNTLASGNLFVGNSSGGAQARAISGDITIDNVGFTTLKNTGTVGTYTKVVTDAQGRVISGGALVSADVTAALGYTPVNKAGDTMSGLLNHGGFDITNTGNITMAASKYLTLSNNTTSGTTAGQMWYDAGVIKYYDGSTVKSLGIAGAGISSLNGLTNTTQTFGNGTTGTSPNWNSSGSGHILHLPMANTTSVTAGLISKTEYDTFNSKMSSALTAGTLWVGNASNGAQAVALTGDIASVSSTGAVTVAKTTTGQVNKILSLDGSGVATMLGLNLVNTGTVSIQAQTASSSYILRLPASSPSANQVMVSDASGNLSWQTNSSLGYTPVNKAGDTMTGTLEVSGNIQTNQGQVYASQNVVASGSTVDFNTGNVQVVQSPGGASITLNNMKDGGSYTVIITDTTSRQYTFNNCTNQHFVPANDLTTASTHSIFTILKVTISSQTHCYISWVTGF